MQNIVIDGECLPIQVTSSESSYNKNYDALFCLSLNDADYKKSTKIKSQCMDEFKLIIDKTDKIMLVSMKVFLKPLHQLGMMKPTNAWNTLEKVMEDSQDDLSFGALEGFLQDYSMRREWIFSNTRGIKEFYNSKLGALKEPTSLESIYNKQGKAK